MKGLTVVMAAAALLAPGARAQVAAQATKVMVTTKDTLRGDRMIIVREGNPRIDSLIKRLNSLPVNSPEFLSVDSALQAAFREMPRPTEFAGRAQVRVGYPGPRGALRTPMDLIPTGWIGFTALGVNESWTSPSGSYVQYFEYPTIVSIEANSPASRAGVRAGDSLMAYNGSDVRRVALNMTQLLTPGRELTVQLRRDGESREVTVVVEKASDRMMAERRMEVARLMAAEPSLVERRNIEAAVTAMARAGGPPGTALSRTPVAASAVMVPRGVMGAEMTDIDANLGSAIRGLDGRKGVFVTFVPAGSLAERVLGLRGGDVILRVDAADVPNVTQLRLRLQMTEQARAEKVKLTILRAGKTQEVSYAPPL